VNSRSYIVVVSVGAFIRLSR